MKPKLIPLALALTLGACSAKDNSSAASAGAAASSVATASDPGSNDISNYTLDMDKMNRWINTMKAIGSEVKKDTTVAAAVSMDDDKSVDQSVAKLEANPGARRALASSGMSAREFVMTSLAYVQAAMTAGMMTSVPNYKVPAGQNMQNVEFYKQHGEFFSKAMRQFNPDSSNN
ncbi:MAG: hypothetical protein ACRD3J_04715 [Thermoanaerobaculia bacterium]